MNEVASASLSYLPITVAALVLLLLAPNAGTRVRAGCAALFGLGAATLAGLAIARRGEVARVAVLNPFFDPRRGEPVPYEVDYVAAPGWQWPAVAALLLLVPAVALWVAREQRPGAPRPIRYALLLTAWMLAARLGLEKTGAPQPLVWALGVTVATVVTLPFFGGWCGVRGLGFGSFAAALLALGLAQRLLVALCGFVATTRQLGTHLDLSAVRSVDLLLGHRDFGGPDPAIEQWLYLIAIPQLLLWVPLTVAAGIVLGGLPFHLTRRDGK